MLDMKPECERCHAPLPMDSADARICSFECSFCAACAAGPLGRRCPNCRGELTPRPRRPAQADCPVNVRTGKPFAPQEGPDTVAAVSTPPAYG